ncbi:MAG TPA: phage holin family protein [Verrucomicrobiae bacterium]|nr:phage holin family protein [Verrucomicrobiae bacterium]
MRKQFFVFLLRWLLSSFGLWLSLRLLGLFGANYDEPGAIGMFFVAGFVISIVNTLLKPIIIILSLPAILLTLGLFTLIVNGFLVYISLLLVPGFEISFWAAVFTGIILSLINYVLSGLLELRKAKEF